MTRGVALSGGGIFCVASASPKGVYLGPGAVISHSNATGDHLHPGGGAISSVFCHVKLDGVSLEHNTASCRTSGGGGGGAVYLGINSKLETSKNCNFSNNRALSAGSGGAVLCDACHSVNLSNGTVFENNVADLHGGAVSLRSPGSKATLSSGSIFRGNTARKGEGGAVHVLDDTANDSMWNSTNGDRFEGNVASEGSGGAFFALGTKIHLEDRVSCSTIVLRGVVAGA